MPPAPSTPKKAIFSAENGSQLRRLLAFVAPYRLSLGIGILTSLLSAGLGLIFPLFFGRLVDASFLQRAAGGAQLDRMVLMLLLIFAAGALLSAAQSYLLSLVGASVVVDLRQKLYSHLLTLSARFYGDHKTGDLISRLTADVGSVQNVASSALAQVVSQSFTLLGGVILLWLTSPRLSLLTLVILPLVIGTAFAIGRQLRRTARTLQDNVAAANADATEALGGIREVQSFTAENLERQRYFGHMTRVREVAVIRSRWQALMSGSMSFLTYSALAIILWYGGHQVIAKAITPGQLVSFLFYAMQVGSTVVGLSSLSNQVQEALGASSRIFELLDEGSDLTEPARPRPLAHPRGEVTLQGVSFAYGTSLVLSDIRLHVAAGEIVALVGPSGSGKTSLVNLLPRFWDVSAGQILLDEHDIREYALADLRAQIGLVPQETLLFSGTVAENIRYGRPAASDAEVIEAAQAANAHGFISAFADGYQTVVGERGVKLSGGQRQRIAIARALLKNPRILILDEATSALDNESEALVQAALERLMVGRTTFVIAHRLSTVRHAHRIVVLDKGKVVQQGTHQHLYAQGGLYRQLYDLQFQEKAPTEAGAD